ncbi:type VII secretion target [Amycolatopsis aidingensis]|uniref:type VII secretion target n=1 Tax=Amycolatopsis aidingensis TaxID=2842453 RepID=UPI0022B62FAA|nr:type VII secretion target [Amycolatopsis aidingensis]
MDFKAEPGTIRKFGERMDELVADANAATTYAEDHLQITGADTRIFATVAGAASDAKAALSENYQRLAKIQQTAATELDKAAAMYQETDDAKAERLDSTYPTGE